MKYIDHHALSDALSLFAKDRDWEKFHTPKNLAMALSSEVGELNEIFQWLSDHEANVVKDNPKKLTAVSNEIADILMYLVRLSDVLGINLNQALEEKIQINHQKYPIDLVQGCAKKYDEYT